MTYLLYVVPQDDFSERVTREDCDATEQAGIIDRVWFIGQSIIK